MSNNRLEYKPVRAVERAFDIVESLSYRDYSTISEICGDVGLHKSTVFNMLTTLMIKGYVEQKEGGRYSLTPRIFLLVREALSSRSLIEEASSKARSLANNLPEFVSLTILDNQDIVVIDFKDNFKQFNIISRANLRQHVKNTVLKFVTSFNQGGGTDSELKEVLEAQGFIIEDESFVVGVRTVMAPIRNHLGTIVGAMGITGLSEELPMSRILFLGQLVKEKSNEVSVRFGFIKDWGSIK